MIIQLTQEVTPQSLRIPSVITLLHCPIKAARNVTVEIIHQSRVGKIRRG